MNGEFISDRKIERILDDLAKKHGIAHMQYSAGWVHVFTKGDKTARLNGYRWSLNDSAASGIARDKVATYVMLAQADVPAIPHLLVRTTNDLERAWPRQDQAVVVKPLEGNAGRGVALFRAVDQARRHMEKYRLTAWTASPYVPIVREIRLIMLDNECLLVYEKQQPVMRGELPIFNLSVGAVGVKISPQPEYVSLAKRAMRVVGVRLAAVDIVLVGDEWRVLEVNDGFGLEHYLRQSDEYFDDAIRVYEKVLLLSLQ